MWVLHDVPFVLAYGVLDEFWYLVFMNKCDVLQRKLASGVRINEHLPSFADRTNDYATFTQCMFLRYSLQSSKCTNEYG